MSYFNTFSKSLFKGVHGTQFIELRLHY